VIPFPLPPYYIGSVQSAATQGVYSSFCFITYIFPDANYLSGMSLFVQRFCLHISRNCLPAAAILQKMRA
jgi:hypothetical protein